MHTQTEYQLYLRFIVLFISLIFIGSSSNQILNNEVFYLSNHTVFKPKEETKVNFYYYGNQRLDLKLTLLKVSDPIKFFINLSKVRSRNNFDIWGKNNQFLLENTFRVRSWNDFLDRRKAYQNFINLGVIDSAGFYILQVKSNSLVAYCPLLVTNYSIISKEYKSNFLSAIVNIETGEIIRESELLMIGKDNQVKVLSPDKDGIYLEKINTKNSDVDLFAKTKDEIIPFNIYSLFTDENQWNLIGHVFTNQPIYRPSQTVNFKAVLRLISGNEIKNFENKICNIKVSSAKNKTVFSNELKTNEYGTLNGSFPLDEEADLGNYSIEISFDDYRVYGNFSVEEYKKPEFKVIVNTNSNHYSFSDTITGSVSAEYYFGAKVNQATVKLSVYRQQYWFPWWRGHHFAWFFDSFEKIRPLPIYENELLQLLEGELDENGNFNFNVEILSQKDFDKNFSMFDYRYKIIAEVTDQSRRSISGFKEVLISRGLFSISTSTDKYFYIPDDEVKIKVNISDFSQKGVQTNYKAIITYPDDKLYRPSQIKDTLLGQTNNDGIGLVLFKPKGNLNGYYSYQIVAIDKKGNEISSGGSFYFGDNKNYFQTRFSNQIEIVTDKDVYEIGDTLTAIIFVPINSQQFLLTTETDEILNYMVIKAKDNSASFKYVIKESCAPNFNLSVCFVNENVFYQNHKSVGVIPKEKYLNIEVRTEKDKYKPRDRVNYFISVKNSKGNPVENAELSFGLTDESLYDIVNLESEPLHKFFFSPRHFYVPTFSNTTNFYFNSISRQITYLEEFYFDSGMRKKDVNFNLNYSGRFIVNDTSFKINLFKAILIGTIKSFTSEIDSLGNFEFNKIPADKYQFFLSNSKGDLLFIKDLIITNDLREQIKVNKALLDKIKQLLDKENEFETIDALRRTNTNVMITESLSIAKASTNGNSKVDFTKPEIRKDFLDAVIWLPEIYTDANGKAKVEVDLPDNLGTWRATIKGITKETSAGDQINKIISTKNLLIRVETPRFLTKGDETTISTIVHNYLNRKKRTKIEINFENLKLISSSINSKGKFKNLSSVKNMYEVTLPPNSEIRIDWRVSTTDYNKLAVVRAEALTNEESDAVEIKIPINPSGIEIQSPFSFDSNEKYITKEIDFEIPSNIDLKTVNVNFNISPTLTTSLLKTLDELVAYPYGCVEQTMSRFLPTLYVNNLLQTQNIKISSSVIEKMPRYVEEGIKRLTNFQQPDGGWGWWTNDRSNPFMTAYVLYGLYFAKENGFAVDDHAFHSGLSNLENQIEEFKEKDDLTILTFMIYVYSKITKENRPNNSVKVKNKFINKLKNINDPFSIALTLLSLKNFGELNYIKNVVSKLESKVTQSGQFAYWESRKENYYWFNDDVQATSYAVRALLSINPDHPFISKAIRWLLMKRQGYGWASTQTSSMVLFAITDYLKVKDELTPDFILSVSLNGKNIFAKKYSNEDIQIEQPLVKISDADKKFLRAGKNKITVTKSGDGSIYFSAMLTYFSEDFNIENKFFNVRRNYYLLEPTQLKGRTVFKKNKIDGEIFAGQDILVETVIKSNKNNLEYLILEDMLPSGFEVVKELSNYQLFEEGFSLNYHNHFYPISGYNHHEYRDEKVVFFSTYFNKETVFRYIIKAQIPGKYRINPAQSYLMYYTEFNGNTESITISVKEKN